MREVHISRAGERADERRRPAGKRIEDQKRTGPGKGTIDAEDPHRDRDGQRLADIADGVDHRRNRGIAHQEEGEHVRNGGGDKKLIPVAAALPQQEDKTDRVGKPDRRNRARVTAEPDGGPHRAERKQRQRQKREEGWPPVTP